MNMMSSASSEMAAMLIDRPLTVPVDFIMLLLILSEILSCLLILIF